MRGLLKIIVFCAVIYGIYCVRGALISSDIRAQSLEYVISVTGTVTANWNRAELDRQADSGLKDQTTAMGNPHALDFAWFAQLGQRTSELACTLVDYSTFKDETHNYIATNYSCDAQFQRGPATILINTMRDKETAPWRVGYFDVTSPVFPSTPPTEKKP